MKLYLAWREPKNREWITVGALWEKNSEYHFAYTKGVRKALESSNFTPINGMEDIEKLYKSKELFPFFKNRILNKSRPEYGSYLSWLGFKSPPSALEELARTNGLRATDSLQLFALPKSIENKYIIYFFNHGINFLSEGYKERLKDLKEGEEIYILKDIQNRFDKLALALRTGDPIEILGYIPRFYTKDVNKLLELNGSSGVKTVIEKVNLNAPAQFQLLCKLESHWHKEFKPFKDETFELITKD